MPRVFISDKLPAAGLDLQRQAGLEIDDRQKLKGAELQEALRGADGVIVRSDTRITAAEL
jgi:D-3-phosphoglycerate dehydrogenase / 2-oxoglutarate reductase